MICGVADSPVEFLVIPDAMCFLEDPELFPKGKSLRDWKFRGLRPRTMMAPECASAIDILVAVDKVAMTLSLITKCCCSSFRRPLFAVAIRNCNLFHWMGNVA